MQSIESRTSWVVAAAALVLMSVAFGAPLVAVVALKPVAATLGVPRSIPALAGSAAYMGSGLGGLLMGYVAERLGVRRVALFGLAMVACGTAVSARGDAASLLIGHGVLIGALGLGCLFAPLVTLVSRWFDRRRGTALALVSSGQYLAGVVWPGLFAAAIDRFGWQATMLGYGLLATAAVAPLCLLLRAAPAPATGGAGHGPRPGEPVLGLPPATAMAAISSAIFLCCVPMAMPPGHLVAFCSDLGLTPARGAAMLSVMLTSAFVARQFWGWMADHAGGLATVLAASTVQATALVTFLITQDEAGLFAVSAAFGAGFSGIVPAYVVAIREHFAEQEAGWRVPVLLLAGQGGMAVGSWLAGAIYDGAGAYAPAFATGVVFNLLNLAVLGLLIAKRPPRRATLAAAA